MPSQPEVWLRGPIPGIIPALQPVAHALMQVAEDLPRLLDELTEEQVWAQPGRSAPIGFHLVHLAGSLSRLVSYAKGESLSADQRNAFLAEQRAAEERRPLSDLRHLVTSTLDLGVSELRLFTAEQLLETREVGRARLPSTTLGLLFHAAEHTARHAGQIQTLARVLR